MVQFPSFRGLAGTYHPDMVLNQSLSELSVRIIDVLVSNKLKKVSTQPLTYKGILFYAVGVLVS